ncbi:hypothetical protein BJD20_20155 [Acinetobacter proteolyticus]|uniref:Uncharacterized protein n=1 Tax=Acinetobacter proteolyticus TaxID=1776741 RepID=A0A653KD15_9GAMM|nr:hypothetical protein BJD20_20155 [Acinetobacter proteolyticus]VXA58399.1 conserved hypothetical protein [Acinetobacter proteolyticus]
MTWRRSAYGYQTLTYNRSVGALNKNRLENINQYLEEYMQHLQTLNTDQYDKITDIKQLIWVIQNEHRCFR